MEALAASLAGAHAGSVALVAFALVSGADLVGVLAGRASDAGSTRESDPLTSRFLGLGALGAGSYVLLRSTYATLTGAHSTPTLLGEGVVALSIVLTVVVFWAARRVLPPSHFDPEAALRWASVRLLLAVSVLAGLVLNGAFDLWMADPLSALPVAGFFFFSSKRLLRSRRAAHALRTPLPETGELLASIVAHIGTEHAGRSLLRVIVCGGGGLGLQTARALAEGGHDVSIVEEDMDRCHALKEENTGAVVFGNATHPDVLRQAGIENCDVVVALSGSAKTNHRICRAAEQEAPVRTMMRVPFAVGAMGAATKHAGVRSLGRLDGDLRVLELRVAASAPIAGRRLSDVQLPSGGRVLSTADGESIDEAKTVFASGERYVVVASEKAAIAMTHLFRDQHRSKPS